MTLALLLQSLYKNQEDDDVELQGVGSNGQQHSLGNGKPILGGNGQMGRSWLPACPANIAAGQAIIWVADAGYCMKVLSFVPAEASAKMCYCGSDCQGATVGASLPNQKLQGCLHCRLLNSLCL